MDFKGINVNSLNQGFPAEKAGLPSQFVLTSINNKELESLIERGFGVIAKGVARERTDIGGDAIVVFHKR